MCIRDSDKTCAIDLLDNVIVPRPTTKYIVHHLCADKGYDYPDLRQIISERRYRVHISRRGISLDEIPPAKRFPARRWVVERTLSWQNDFRSLRVRWSKNPENWLALNHFACALVLWQMATR